jgi:hypothetical protein
MSQAVFSRAWTIPKDGSTLEQNEDAWRLEPFVQEPWREGVLITLADGTTEAVYSGAWARKLVGSAEPGWPTLSPTEWERRLEMVKRSFAPLDRDSAVPWYVRNKYLTQGSQATLLAATLSQEPGLPGRVLRALAVGDCCLFLLKPKAQVFAFPLVNSSEFGQSPALITNRTQTNLEAQRCEALVQPGELLIACSDALARWLLQIVELGEIERFFELLTALLLDTPTNELGSPGQIREWHGWKHWLKSMRSWLRTDTGARKSPVDTNLKRAEFDTQIKRERSCERQPRLRNDDTTLIVCLPLEPDTGPVNVLEQIGFLRQQFAAASAQVRPLHEAGVPESGRRWLMPWNLPAAQMVD